MYNLKIYKQRNINYNIISKTSCIKTFEIPFNIENIKLTINNILINCSYNYILILFILKFISKSKPIITKSKKNIIHLGIQKYDNLNGFVTIRNNSINTLFLKIIAYKKNKLIKKKNYTYSKNNLFIYNIPNINKIEINFKNEPLFIYSYNLKIEIKKKQNFLSNYKYSNNIKFLLSHYNFIYSI